MDKKLTDSEIVKALENEIHLAEYVDSDYCSNTEVSLLKSALDLINRLQAENERLSQFGGILLRNGSELFKEIQTAKAEAYKECIEKVKEKAFAKHKTLDNEYLFEFDGAFLDNLLKELIGEPR